MDEVIRKAKLAQKAGRTLASLEEQDRSRALRQIAADLREHDKQLIEANALDMDGGREAGMSDSLLDRLHLDSSRIHNIAGAVEHVAELPNPLLSAGTEWERPNGLRISEVRVPLGVIGVIYEARPNVTVDITALALKTGNAVVLRGSSSTIHSNKALVKLIRSSLEAAGLPPEAVQLIENTDRQLTDSLFTARGLLDVIIPRGSKKLIDTVVEKSTVPVIETGAGNCHLYIHEDAEPLLARQIAVDAKAQRPSVCNAVETFLLDKSWAEAHFSRFVQDMQLHGVTLYGDERAQQLHAAVIPADETSWSTEFHGLEAAVKITENLQEALDHIDQHSTKHSEAIVAEDGQAVEQFFRFVDASTLYHNASTRFTDGEEFGYGAEVGISTQKLHARGPMGLEALTTVKYLVQGNGQKKGNLPLSQED
ncbi:glutamate-5-semialdehyde dehydrogenase [Alkalicoccus chagannorensis]|uniref:glutamate-5-semialdehyde dehydrogenase n=1 Tax=Alkalicoccus chagannorensis TaxID=427072 RepID=UPI0004292FD6|nr:glutamate-5-semialdehyde dehydrogenase [Alkalicoccus chagannorensis]